jgi:hypothetical protein
MYLLSVSYLGCAALVVYVEFRGPEDPGIELASVLAPAVAGHRAGSPAARADMGRRPDRFRGAPRRERPH